VLIEGLLSALTSFQRAVHIARGAHCAPRRVTASQREERRKHRESESVTLYGWPIHMRPTAPGSPSQDLCADPVAT